MKKFSLILGIFLSTFALEAFSSDLNLKMFNNSRFCVELDNQFYSNFTSEFYLRDLAPGNHYLVVYKYRNNGYGNGHGRGHGGRSSYSVVYSGYIHIPLNMVVYGMIDHYSRFVVTARQPLYAHGYNSYGNNNGRNYNNHNGGNNNKYGNNSHHENGYAMSPGDFNALKIAIGHASFESTRFGIARNAVVNNSLTSNQVMEILYMFSFESTRLDFAKLAYPSVVDKDRFYLVYTAFSFDSSINELDRYIARF